MTGRRDKICWAAGFLDGEGCFSATRVARRDRGGAATYYAHIRATQVVVEPLEILRDLFGGEIKLIPSGSDETRLGKQDIYEWRIWHSSDVCAAIDILVPYLVVKKKKAKLLRSFSGTFSSSRKRLPASVHARREQLINEMKSIK